MWFQDDFCRILATVKTPEPASSPLVDVKEAARRLGISSRTLERIACDGDLPVVRLSSRCVRYRPEDIERLIVQRTSTEGATSR